MWAGTAHAQKPSRSAIPWLNHALHSLPIKEAGKCQRNLCLGTSQNRGCDSFNIKCGWVWVEPRVWNHASQGCGGPWRTGVVLIITQSCKSHLEPSGRRRRPTLICLVLSASRIQGWLACFLPTALKALPSREAFLTPQRTLQSTSVSPNLAPSSVEHLWAEQV